MQICAIVCLGLLDELILGVEGRCTVTELEKIERAKMYMDHLANGINPLDNTPIADTELINNVRLSRCFFFVSNLLRQVIENGGIDAKTKAKTKKDPKVPLDISLEQREQFAYSPVPIPVSEIARRINVLIDTETMQKLPYSGIVNWLLEIGMLAHDTTSDGKQVKRPTDNGRSNGISVELRHGSNGPYSVVVYNNEAQHFILDNLDAIIAEENLQCGPQTPWTPEQDERLIALYNQSVSINEIAVALNRKSSSVRRRLKKWGFPV